MRTTIPLGFIALLAVSVSSSQAQSFADWSGLVDGSTSGNAAWEGYGIVSYQLQYQPASDGDDVQITPFATQTAASQADYAAYTISDPFSINDPNKNNWLAFDAGSLDNSSSVGVGYDLTFTFNGGQDFPSTDPVFYLADIDSGNFSILASNDGTAVDASSWYYGAAQIASPGDGPVALWDPATSSLLGQGASTLYIHQFKPTAAFDTLTFQYQNGSRQDRILFAVGDVTVTPIPEPSSALLGAAALGLGLLRRRRA